MQFKHPELLYALFLLLIPIFIHLFQLRRFQKVAFTNVAFLKKVSIQTRKSSQLKKWLTLLARLLALACVILAFTQPFSASKTALNTEKETVIYIDNSFSMQAKGKEGQLLQRALQQLYSQTNTTDKISWFTNDFSKKNIAIQDFKNEILAVNYSQKQLSLEAVLLKSEQLFSKNNPNSNKRLLILSDFQEKGTFPETDYDFKIDAVPFKSNKRSNVSIDSAFIFKKNRLRVLVSSQENQAQDLPISLYNDGVLVAKTALNFSETTEEIKTATIDFDINSSKGFKGKLEVNDPNLLFDNTLFFTINIPKKINVLLINNSEANYLQRIFNNEEFEVTQQNSEGLNYSDFAEQNMIVLNELTTISNSLNAALKSFSENGGTLFIVPSNDMDITSYNQLYSQLQMGVISEIIPQEKKITQITFNHPVYTDVFEKQVINFQYPKVNSYYSISTLATPLLRFEDGKPFLIQKGNTYVSTASFSLQNSNFQSSPLIVPTLYNMAQQSLALPKLYFEIGIQNQFSVPVTLGKDEILKIKDSVFSFIPLQQTKATQVNITTENEPSKSGIYSIERNSDYLESVSYNYNRSESLLVYSNPENWDGVTVHNSINDLFDSISEENLVTSYWKWLVTFALLFLITEMLLLKYLKN